MDWGQSQQNPKPSLTIECYMCLRVGYRFVEGIEYCVMTI